MINGKTIIVIVPARRGSKGLPGKNVKLLCGKPLIAWSIEAGLGSRYVDEVMVSTDCEEIATVATKFGATVPFIRPAELANDTANSIDVIRHALDFYQNNFFKSFDYTVLLEPTSPLRVKDDVDDAIEQLVEHHGASSIVGICRTEGQNPAFLVRRGKNGFLSGYENLEMPIMRRQDIDDVYFFEGSIYISKTEVLLKQGTFYHGATIGHVFPKWKSIEIDDIDDFIMVEALFKHRVILGIE